MVLWICCCALHVQGWGEPTTVVSYSSEEWASMGWNIVPFDWMGAVIWGLCVKLSCVFRISYTIKENVCFPL
jgi:hypothetical protein